MDATTMTAESVGTKRSIVEVVGLSKSFRSAEGATVAALRDVSLSIAAGKFTTLLGPSGCGKTTLLRAIGGFDEPDQGTVRIDGEDMTGAPPYARPVNTVFQQYALFPHLTIAGNVAYGLEVAGVARAEIDRRVEEALALVRLSGFGGRRASQLSGGQQQRVALARSLVLRPKVLLLDEPLAALDRKLRKEMQVELKRLQHEVGIAFLCVTHDQEEALSMSDTVVVMNAGRIEQIGTPRDVYDRPATRFVAGFVGEVSQLACRIGPTEAGLTRLDLDGGDHLMTAASELPKGGAVALIRPERLTLAASVAGAGSGLHVIAGVVGDTVYLGDKSRLEVQLAGGSSLHALLDGAIDPPEPGEAIALAYSPEHVRVVPA